MCSWHHSIIFSKKNIGHETAIAFKIIDTEKLSRLKHDIFTINPINSQHPGIGLNPQLRTNLDILRNIASNIKDILNNSVFFDLSSMKKQVIHHAKKL